MENECVYRYFKAMKRTARNVNHGQNFSLIYQIKRCQYTETDTLINCVLI